MEKGCDNKNLENIKNEFIKINKKYINKYGINENELRQILKKKNEKSKKKIRIYYISTIFTVLISILFYFFEPNLFSYLLSYALGTRCILPNNYFIWEATRPISDCQFCINVTKPIILPNVTREQFAPYAFSSKPIIVKNAVKHWRATKYFSFDFLKKLYDETEGSYESVDEECQFLHFHSDFVNLRDVFSMSEARSKFLLGEKPWYIGWCNCNPNVLKKMREFYPIPHFLPENSELSHHEYIFMGYHEGATMHLDFIPRLMWQAQLIGNKTWNLIPSPECESKCQSFSFYVEPGDAMLLDTRVWYHGTTIAPGEFSLTIQSEYS